MYRSTSAARLPSGSSQNAQQSVWPSADLPLVGAEPTERTFDRRKEVILELVEFWKSYHGDEAKMDDVVMTLDKISDELEAETERYLRCDPDPLALCVLPMNHLMEASADYYNTLKIILNFDLYADSGHRDLSYDLHATYLQSSKRSLRVAAARLLANVIPIYEHGYMMFTKEAVRKELYDAARQLDTTADELGYYSLVLVTRQVDCGHMQTAEKEELRKENAALTPHVLKQLRALRKQQLDAAADPGTLAPAPTDFSSVKSECFTKPSERPKLSDVLMCNGHVASGSAESGNAAVPPQRCSARIRNRSAGAKPTGAVSPPRKKPRLSAEAVRAPSGDLSNSSFSVPAPYVREMWRLKPLSNSMRQQILFQYLFEVGAGTKEILRKIAELWGDGVGFLFDYLDQRKNKDVYLTFGAIALLSKLVSHRKIAIQFVHRGGIDLLLSVPKESLCSPVVSLLFATLCEVDDAMEKVCSTQPRERLRQLITTMLWIVDRSYETGRTYATQFLCEAFRYRPILHAFDELHGLRTVLNYASTLRIWHSEPGAERALPAATAGSSDGKKKAPAASGAAAAAENAPDAGDEQADAGGDGRRRAALRALREFERDAASNHSNDDPDEESNSTRRQNSNDDTPQLSDNVHSMCRRSLAAVISVLKCYLMGHLYKDVELLKRVALGDGGRALRSPLRNLVGVSLPERGVPSVPVVATSRDKTTCKAMQMGMDDVRDWCWLLLDAMPSTWQWAPAGRVASEGFLPYVLYVLGRSLEWRNEPKAFIMDTLRDAFDVLMLLCVAPANHTMLVECKSAASAYVGTDSSNAIEPMITMLFDHNQDFHEDVKRFSLRLLAMLCCAPTDKPFAVDRPTRASRMYAVVSGVWSEIRRRDGLPALRDMLGAGEPSAYAYCNRACAARSLCGLARLPAMANVIEHMPGVDFRMLMAPPVDPSQLDAFQQFARYARLLIERLTGASVRGLKIEDWSLASVRKAQVVANTRITFNKNELLNLMFRHLQDEGLSNTAALLKQEASMAAAATSTSMAHHAALASQRSPAAARTPLPVAPSGSKGRSGSGRKSQTGKSRRSSARSHPVVDDSAAAARPSGTAAAPPASMRLPPSVGGAPQQTPGRGGDGDTSAQCARTISLRRCGAKPSTPITGEGAPKFRMFAGGVPRTTWSGEPYVRFADLAHEHFRAAHATCKKPMAHCPPFSFFQPHRCPVPNRMAYAPKNFTARHHRRSIFAPRGGIGGLGCDMRLLYSRYQPGPVIHSLEGDVTAGEGMYTGCTFSNNDQYLLLGTSDGGVNVFEMRNGAPHYVDCDGFASAELTTIKLSPDDSMIITGTSWDPPLSSLRSFKITEEGHLQSREIRDFEEEIGLNFAPGHRPTAVIGCNENYAATIYDIATGDVVTRLYSDESHKASSEALFHPFDETMVLNDGVLWDTRQPKLVHRFDRFSEVAYGYFHPRGLDILINTEVWDVRTRRLRQSVADLASCHGVFTSTGDVLLCAPMVSGDEGPNPRYFRALDARDYTTIYTMHTKHQVLCIDTTKCSDALVALIEDDNDDASLDEVRDTACRIYEVGRRRDQDYPCDNDADDEQEHEAGTERHSDDDDDFDEDDDDDDDEDDDDAQAIGSDEASDILDLLEDQLDNERASSGRSSGTSSSSGDDDNAADGPAEGDRPPSPSTAGGNAADGQAGNEGEQMDVEPGDNDDGESDNDTTYMLNGQLESEADTDSSDHDDDNDNDSQGSRRRTRRGGGAGRLRWRLRPRRHNQ